MKDHFECKWALVLGNSQFGCLNIAIERRHGFPGVLQSCELENREYSDIFKNLSSPLAVAGLLASTSNMKLAFLYTGLCIGPYFALGACILPWSSLLVLSTKGSKLCYRNTGTGFSLRDKLVWLKYVHKTIILSVLIWIVYLELAVFRNWAIKFILLYLDIWSLETNAILSEHLEECQNLYYFASSKVILTKELLIWFVICLPKWA